jgi:hypothetical protein
MAVRLVAVGYVDDTQRPFQYFCSSAPNGINPIADAHRTGTGQFNFTFDPAAFAGSPQVLVSSAGACGESRNNAIAYVRHVDSKGFSIDTNTINSPRNTSFHFLILEHDGWFTTAGVEDVK